MRLPTCGLFVAAAIVSTGISHSAEKADKPDANAGHRGIVLEGLPHGGVRISDREGSLLECTNLTLMLPFDEPRERRSARATITGDPESGEVKLSIQQRPGQPSTSLTAKMIRIDTWTMDARVVAPNARP
jgi:hypothetical protein